MMDMMVWMLVGAFIGWHVPQPGWAKWMQDKVMGMFKK